MAKIKYQNPFEAPKITFIFIFIRPFFLYDI
jgi:hypothetical protein